jgi:hypothetical protein
LPRKAQVLRERGVLGAQNLKHGAKRTLVWACGAGIASDPEPDGNIALTLSGYFKPGKLFSILAAVDDPAPGQTLALELPPGMERVEVSVQAAK